MFFTSYEFFGFIIVLFVVYYLIPQKFQWMLLLAASYVFYFAADPGYLIYILVTTATVYATALLIEKNQERQTLYLKSRREEMSREERKAYKEARHRERLRWLLLGMLLNLGILAVMKYTNFFIANVNSLMKGIGQQSQLSFVSLVLPMGISFYTFQALGYLIDVYRGTVPAEKNIFRFALFVSFFPQLVQGPISRFGDLAKTLYARHAFDYRTVSYGLQRMLWGYFKKMVIADRLLVGVLNISKAPEEYYGAYAFAGMLFYTVQLYADFTGGIDITIGIAQVLGVTMQENFDRPYFSKSLKEYWRRWHITMGTWFKDYIFYPLSVSMPMQKLSKFSRAHLGKNIGKRLPVYVSSFVVWFATGIWHGANWTFIVWGLANYVVLMVSEELEPLYERFHKRFRFSSGWWYKLFQVGRTFLLISVLKMFDCYTSVGTTFKMFGSMFTAGNWKVLWDGSLLELGMSTADYVVLAVGTVVLLAVSLLQRSGSVRDKIAARPYPVRAVLWIGLFVSVLVFGAYGIGYDASQFIYNRF